MRTFSQGASTHPSGSRVPGEPGLPIQCGVSHHSPCVSKDSQQISVIVPCYNEAATVVKLVRRVRAALPEAQVVVVDDGSTDGSGQLISRMSPEFKVDVVCLGTNRGKGAAFRAALPLVNRKYLIIQDADLEYSPADISRLLAYAIDQNMDAVYGSRYLMGSRQGALANYCAVKLLGYVLWLRHGLLLSDVATCYKLFRTDLVKSWPLTSCGFELCQELNLNAANGCRLCELGIDYTPRDRKSGKKIRGKDFWTSLAMLLRRKANKAKMEPAREGQGNAKACSHD